MEQYDLTAIFPAEILVLILNFTPESRPQFAAANKKFNEFCLKYHKYLKQYKHYKSLAEYNKKIRRKNIISDELCVRALFPRPILANINNINDPVKKIEYVLQITINILKEYPNRDECGRSLSNEFIDCMLESGRSQTFCGFIMKYLDKTDSLNVNPNIKFQITKIVDYSVESSYFYCFSKLFHIDNVDINNYTNKIVIHEIVYGLKEFIELEEPKYLSIDNLIKTDAYHKLNFIYDEIGRSQYEIYHIVKKIVNSGRYQFIDLIMRKKNTLGINLDQIYNKKFVELLKNKENMSSKIELLKLIYNRTIKFYNVPTLSYSVSMLFYDLELMGDEILMKSIFAFTLIKDDVTNFLHMYLSEESTAASIEADSTNKYFDEMTAAGFKELVFLAAKLSAKNILKFLLSMCEKDKFKNFRLPLSEEKNIIFLNKNKKIDTEKSDILSCVLYGMITNFDKNFDIEGFIAAVLTTTFKIYENKKDFIDSKILIKNYEFSRPISFSLDIISVIYDSLPLYKFLIKNGVKIRDEILKKYLHKSIYGKNDINNFINSGRNDNKKYNILNLFNLF